MRFQGAYNLGQWLEAKYGSDSMAMLVDEGNGVSNLWGQVSRLCRAGDSLAHLS